MMSKQLICLILGLAICQSQIMPNGVLPVRRGKVYAEIRMGEIMVYEPFSAVFKSEDVCLGGILEEVNKQADAIFPSIPFPNVTKVRTERFIGAILAGAAMGVAAGALATGIAATVMATENKKNIADNRAAINNLRDDSLKLKEGLNIVSEALDEVATVVGAIQGYINNDLLPAMAHMSCEIQRNTFRSRLLAYWLSLISKYQNLISNPYAEVPAFAEEQRIKNDADIAAIVFNKYGLHPDEFKGAGTTIRISLVECKDRVLLLMASIYRTQDTGRTLIQLPRVPLSDSSGGAVVSSWPEHVACKGTEMKECHSLSATCEIKINEARCTVIDIDSPINMECDRSCSFISSETTMAFMGDGEGGVIVNCALISCKCDGRGIIGVQHFVAGSCAVLLLKDTIALRLRELGEVVKDPIGIPSDSGFLPPAIDLQNNISSLSGEVKDVISDVGNWNALGPLTSTPYPMIIWLAIVTVFLMALIIGMIVAIVKIKDLEEAKRSEGKRGEVNMAVIPDNEYMA